ncbi:MAG: peptidoglycan DD-metalloendopeptidase family protein [Actinobacteria bacterium]|nr:peptidoglycan DD-metalloendopeptidase family protein [Actinomycetota bacterium]
MLASAGFRGSIAPAGAARTPAGTTHALAAAHRQHDAIERTIASLQSRVHRLYAARDRVAARLTLPGALNPVSAPTLYITVARGLPRLADELVRTREALMHLDRRRREVAGRIERLRARFFREWERRRDQRAREAEKAASAATRVAVPAAPSIPRVSGTFQSCPVPGGSYRDSFGILSMRGGAHIHQGIDVFASYGTPVLAPFAGRAEVATNPVGGLAVKVFGPAGYVYNAHLAAIGATGAVLPGDVIGFVGTSGNAVGTAPHDHLEWHPAGGDAASPFGLLNQAC